MTSAEPLQNPPAVGQAVNTSALLRALRERFAASGDLRIAHVAGHGIPPPRPVRTRTILGADVAREYGRPGEPSAVTTLVAARTDVEDGRITLSAPTPRPDTREALSLGVVAVAAADSIADIDCYGLRNAVLRIDGLDGVSVRAMPGRLWVRMNHAAVVAGVGPLDFGAAIHAACRRVRGVTAVELFVAAGDAALVSYIEPFVAISSAQTGEHVRLKWNAFGDLECNSMDCRSCDEAPVCDQLRQVIRIRGKRRKKSNV